MQALERLEGLYRDRRLFPELGPRKRSERIEAMVLVGRAILATTDRLTLRSGVYVDGELVRGITMKTIARWARIERQRAYRALWDLRDAGYVDCHQPIEKRSNGERRGLAGIRRVTPRLFERLNLGGRLKRERREAYRLQHAAKTLETIAERKRLRRLFRESHRAAILAKRTIEQLAQRLAHVPTQRTYTVAEIEAQLAARRDRERT